jgi:hypothetical protein
LPANIALSKSIHLVSLDLCYMDLEGIPLPQYKVDALQKLQGRAKPKYICGNASPNIMKENKAMALRELPLEIDLSDVNTLLLKDHSQLTNQTLSRLTNLTFLKLGYSKDIDVRGVSTLTKLRTLWRRENQGINNHCLRKLSNLSHLNLGSGPGITKDGLSLLTNLVILNCGTGCPELSNYCLTTLTNLTDLDARNTDITSAGLLMLPKLKRATIYSNCTDNQELLQLNERKVVVDVKPFIW